MEIIGVIMLSFAVCFITLIITLVFLTAKVLSDKPKTKVLTNTYDAWKNHDNQELFDTGKMSTVVGLKFTTAPPNKSATCASNETPPDHKTRVKLRKKRKSKQEK